MHCAKMAVAIIVEMRLLLLALGPSPGSKIIPKAVFLNNCNQNVKPGWLSHNAASGQYPPTLVPLTIFYVQPMVFCFISVPLMDACSNSY
jgi:hypothetical protein